MVKLSNGGEEALEITQENCELAVENNNYYLITNHLTPYPTYIPPVFQCFALQDFLIYHLLLYYLLAANRSDP